MDALCDKSVETREAMTEASVPKPQVGQYLKPESLPACRFLTLDRTLVVNSLLQQETAERSRLQLDKMFSRTTMMSRQAIRSGRTTFVRPNSTSSTTQKVSETASSVASKASTQASAAASKATAAASSVASRVSSVSSGVAGMREPITYWSKVAGQVAKQIYQAEKMSPPSMAQVESTARSVFKSLSTGQFVNAIKGMSQKDAVKLGVDGLTIYGFFVVGEMVGRRHVSFFTLVSFNVLTRLDGRLRGLSNIAQRIFKKQFVDLYKAIHATRRRVDKSIVN